MFSKINIRESFTSNFDVSVVMPFYKKMKELKRVFPANAKYFQRNGIELIVVMDSSDEKNAILDFIKEYPFVNWRIIVNYNSHPWRNPARAINVGIRHSSNKYIMVCSPESEMLTDVIYLLRKSFEDYVDYHHYAYGRVCYVDQEDVTYENYDVIRNIPFGSVMVEKSDLEFIGGYDESLTEWGGDDNNLRARLNLIGCKGLHVEKAMMVHRDLDNPIGKKRRTLSIEKLTESQLRHFFYPKNPTPNCLDWGRDFDCILYDYRFPKLSKDDILRIATTLGLSDIFLSNDYRPNLLWEKMLLVSCRNEEKRIVGFIDEVSQYFDSIIILDDSSEDMTYQLCMSEKILLKARKKHVNFSDIDNRNILLRLACLFSHKFLFFLDVDERIDERFNNFASLNSLENGTALLVPQVNLWNDAAFYNSEYPKSINGICFRFKGVKSIGNSQIESDKRLHFPQVPTYAKTAICSEILILHYGMLTLEDRLKKYSFYKIEDTDNSQNSYSHLLDQTVAIKKVADLDIDIIRNAILKIG